MHAFLRKLFWFILKYFEKGNENYVYKPMNRMILNVVGLMFCGLAITTFVLSFSLAGYGFLIPVFIFLSVGITCLIVGFLGTDRAVAKIWGNR